MPQNPCLVIGSGPAALMAADVLVAAGLPVQVFERRGGPGWKLLVAGSSGLNVTHEASPEEFPGFYPERREEVAAVMRQFGKDDWLRFLHGLGEETYVGTSRRYFVKNFKASSLLKAWTERLQARGVIFHYGKELKDFAAGEVRFSNGTGAAGSAVVLALGGWSWETEPSRWPEAFRAKGIPFVDFAPSNAGYSFAAPAGFFAAAEGKPIKGLTLTTARGTKTGELMITRYGLEGTPVYTLGCPGVASVDLKPDLSEAKLAQRLQPFRGDARQKLRGAKLSDGAFLLFEALAPAAAWENAAAAAHALKHLPIELLAPSPLSECISSRGGVSWDALSENLELNAVPGVFCAGEMIDWDAPTGGFLLQASVSTGFVAGKGAVEFARARA